MPGPFSWHQPESARTHPIRDCRLPFIVYTINRWTFRSTRRKMRATLPCMAFRLRGPSKGEQTRGTPVCQPSERQNEFERILTARNGPLRISVARARRAKCCLRSLGKLWLEGCCDPADGRRVPPLEPRYPCVCRRRCSLAGKPKVPAGKRAWWKCSQEGSNPLDKASESISCCILLFSARTCG